MSVHYKFKSAISHDTIAFDGLHISVKDLKRDILHQKQIGKTGDFDLLISNAQTQEVYEDDNALIPKNSSLIVVRVPLTVQQKRAWERQEANQQQAGLKYIHNNTLPIFPDQTPTAKKLAKVVDLSTLNASEDDKIMAMISQSTHEYDPSNYARLKGSSQVGEVPLNYRCYKCHQPGHWIKDCRLGSNQENQPEIKKSTGIPRSFMVPVAGPSVPGAMMTPSGQFAVPSIDQQAYLEGKKPSLPESMLEKPSIPEELVCSICHDLLTDTVMVPCCGSSFCDECIRTTLLESDNQECPDCKEIGVSPNTMIPNRYLRKAVDTFRNSTGYQRNLASLTPISSQPPGNSLVQIPVVQPIQTVGTTRLPEVINLTDTDSPHRGHTHPNNLVPSVRPTHPSSNTILSSKGGDVRGPPPMESARMHYPPPDRSSTPTIDERSVTTSLPDTSVPPPGPSYAITSLGTAMPPAYGPPPGYHGPPPPSGYARAPLPYPNLGPGPNYPIHEPRGNVRPGYRPFLRGARHGIRMQTGYRDRAAGPPHVVIEDPLAAFEKLLREKDLARERNRRRKRSFSRSPSPRMRSRSRSRSPPPHRKRGSVSPSPPARQRSPSPPPRPRHSRSPASPPRVRSPRGKQWTRSRTRSRSPQPKRRSPSFTISRSRSRSFSRTPSPRDRHYSPRRRDDARFRSPIHSPQRYNRNYKDFDGQYYDSRSRGRSRGYGRGRGGESSYYPSSPPRHETRYEDRPRSYTTSQQSGTSQSARYTNRRYDNYTDTVPPGTEPVNYDRYSNDYGDRMASTITSDTRESKRDRELREAAARDWERTRDREIEQREKERLKEYEEYHRSTNYHKSDSPEKRNKRSRERGKENKLHSEVLDPINSRTLTEQSLESRYKNMSDMPSQTRVPVLIELKKEPSVEKKKEETAIPTKEKKKDKKKKKDSDKKEKKKKRKEKKEVKSGEKPISHKTIEAKPIVVGIKEEVPQLDPLYGDIEGAKVDKEVVENYGKVEQKVEEMEVSQPAETVPKENVVLAPVPELSKWELDEDLLSTEDRTSADDISSTDKKVVTSEVLKRAENAIFQKAINAIRPVDVAKKVVVQEKVAEKIKDKKDLREGNVHVKDVPSQEPIKVVSETQFESREARKVANSIQITIPSHQTKTTERSVEIAVTTTSGESTEPSKSRSRLDKVASPVRVSAKERLGAKVDTDKEDVRRVRSAVERKSRSKTPKRFYNERKFNDRAREISPGGRRVVLSSSWAKDNSKDETKKRDKTSDITKSLERRSEKNFSKDKDRRSDKVSRSSSKEKKLKSQKNISKKRDEKMEDKRQVKVDTKEIEKRSQKNVRLSTDKKKSAIDEANFEPDYDEIESELEVPGEEKTLLVNVTLGHPSPSKKRSRSLSNEKDKKKMRHDVDEKKPAEKSTKETKPIKMQPDTEDTSDTESSSDSSSDSSVERKKHKKKKKSKKRKKKKAKKRRNSSSDSDSSESSSSDSDAVKKKRRHKHKRKSGKSKKKKKSKHK